MLISLSPTRTIFKLFLHFIMHPVKKKKERKKVTCYFLLQRSLPMRVVMRRYFWSSIHSQQMDLRPAASTLALTTLNWLLPYTKAWLTAHQGLEELQTTHHLWPSVHKDVNNEEESRCFDNQSKDSEEGTTWTSSTDRQRSKIHFSQAIRRGWVWDLSHVNAVHRKVNKVLYIRVLLL